MIRPWVARCQIHCDASNNLFWGRSGDVFWRCIGVVSWGTLDLANTANLTYHLERRSPGSTRCNNM